MKRTDPRPIRALPRRLLEDGWWLATPPRPDPAKIIPFPSGRGAGSRIKGFTVTDRLPGEKNR
jgi:hypothetical protein